MEFLTKPKYLFVLIFQEEVFEDLGVVMGFSLGWVDSCMI